MEKNSSNPDEGNGALGSTTMIITVTCIVGAFAFALLLQFLIKLFWRRTKRDWRNEQTDATFHFSDSNSLNQRIPEVIPAPPSYENIHLYKQLDLTSCTPVYYNVPGTKHYFGIIIKDEIVGEEDAEGEPPSYHPTDDEDFEEDDEILSHEVSFSLPDRRASVA